MALSALLPAAHPIIIDGLFDDWADVPAAYSDSSGDGPDEDFDELKVTNDDDFLFLFFTFHDGEHLLQDWNTIHLYLETDDDPTTGWSFHGIGAELDWCFGCRSGTMVIDNEATDITQNDLTLRTAPTVTGTAFEVAIHRNSAPLTLNGAQSATVIRLVLASDEPDGDRLPDEPGGVSYEFDPTPVPAPEPLPLGKTDDQQLRILTYNTLQTGLFDAERQPRFRRIIQALAPDIIGLQEHYQNPDGVDSLIAAWLPGSAWYRSTGYAGNLVVSRFPVVHDTVLIASGRTQAVLLATESVLGSDLLLLNSHFACCDANASRQHDADELIQVLRDWRYGTGPFPLAAETPIVHLGDFNLVGYRQQLLTLTAGDIVNEAAFGPDFAPDWDGTDLADLFSRHTHLRMGYTWRNDQSSYSPGKLDYLLYTDSVIEIGNHFVLNTLVLPDSVLVAYNLEREDTPLASDHLPRVMDIAAVHPVAVDNTSAFRLPGSLHLGPVYPNPFNAIINIRVEVVAAVKVRLTVCDLRGRVVTTLVSGVVTPGSHRYRWDAARIGTGIYFIRLESPAGVQARKVVVLK
jgi:endonuclease/exonuclease/phosphatase family metal-dependent hydrolase